MNSQNVYQDIATTTAKISAVLTYTVPEILVLAGVLIALAISVWYIFTLIGTSETNALIYNDLDKQNRKAVAQMENSQLLALGDKVQQISYWDDNDWDDERLMNWDY